jgi:flavin reductase (DIM6/NTAB) family NADH-FMN oxidoreductase RutF
MLDKTTWTRADACSRGMDCRVFRREHGAWRLPPGNDETRNPGYVRLIHRRVSAAMSEYLEFDPAIVEKRQVYRLLTGAVVPRPIGWASSVSKTGVANLAPFSFFTVVCVIPPMISLTIARNPDGSEKHTLKNVRDTGEFCFNVVTEPVWKEMVDSANAFPAGDSEFAATGLTPIPSVKVKAPRVKEVPIHFECKLERVIELGPNRHPLVIGEVVYMHVDPACMTNGYIDMKKLHPIGRLNGFFYSTLGEIFEREFNDGQPR